ncbi:aminotransferase class IV [Candidatus Peregrinibacteria bacterium]|nr:aminotransferase class IV [Candidatus Peregrinibacteria bacterium]
MFVFLNGQFVSADKAKISVFDHGFLYGDAVYETLRTYSGYVWQVEKHVRRLFMSARCISMKLPWKKSQVVDWIQMAVSKNRDVLGDSTQQGLKKFFQEFRIRVTVSRGVNHFDFGKPEKPTIFIIIELLKPESKSVYEQGVKVITYHVSRIFPEVKTTNMVPTILARQEMARKKAYEALLVDRKGYVTEGTVTNVFIVKNDVLLTSREDILFGTTRDVILKIAHRFMKVKFCEIPLRELYRANECFICNAPRGIIPVTFVDSRKIFHGKVGVYTRSIMEKYEKMIQDWVFKQ